MSALQGTLPAVSMGYSHEWFRPQIIQADMFRAVHIDVEQLVLPLSDAGVNLAGWHGKDSPEITDDLISFNGPKNCGHPRNKDIVNPYPAEYGQGVGPS